MKIGKGAVDVKAISAAMKIGLPTLNTASSSLARPADDRSVCFLCFVCHYHWPCWRERNGKRHADMIELGRLGRNTSSDVPRSS